MKSNVFKFGDTWFILILGTAMGTPCACIYAILYFAYWETVFMLKKYDGKVLLHKRFIDDGLGVSNPNAHLILIMNDFKEDLNKFGPLYWIITELSSKINFLDVTLEICQETGELSYKPYSKEMSLHLYIPS